MNPHKRHPNPFRNSNLDHSWMVPGVRPQMRIIGGLASTGPASCCRLCVFGSAAIAAGRDQQNCRSAGAWVAFIRAGVENVLDSHATGMRHSMSAGGSFMNSSKEARSSSHGGSLASESLRSESAISRRLIVPMIVPSLLISYSKDPFQRWKRA